MAEADPPTPVQSTSRYGTITIASADGDSSGRRNSIRYLIDNELFSYSRSSQRIELRRKIDLDSTQAPLTIFGSILDLLLENDIFGPTLFRLESEFNKEIGHGRTFDVLALNDESEQKLAVADPRSDSVGIHSRIGLSNVVVKRAREQSESKGGSSTGLSSPFSAKAFGQQLSCVEREILALCHEKFRKHPNIVNIVGWGLCLDTLEDGCLPSPRIPLLVLERAHSTFSAFIRQYQDLPGPERYTLFQHLCLGTGRGLEAIHLAGYAHGDVKLDNILIFREGSGWIAKVCDFGLSTEVDLAGKAEGEYGGTDGWLPPPGSARLTSRSFQACDIFAYGLVVWCAFTGRSHSPLPLKSLLMTSTASAAKYSEANLYSTAASEVRHTSLAAVPMVISSTADQLRINRLLIVLRGCLHADPRMYDYRPWKYFDSERFPSIVGVIENPTALMSAAQSIENRFDRIRSLELPLKFSGLLDNTTKKLNSVPRPSLEQQVLSQTERLKQRALRIYRPIISPLRSSKSKRQRDLERIYTEYCNELRMQLSPDDLAPLSHSGRRCYDLSLIRRQLVWAATLLKKKGSGPWTLDDLYALSRLRSRFPLCCWQSCEGILASAHSQFDPTTNILGEVIKFRFDFTCVAWLCRGEIGEYERDRLKPSQAWGGWLSDPKISPQDKLKRSMLLVEKGFRTDSTIYDDGKEYSILRLLIEQLQKHQSQSEFSVNYLFIQSDVQYVRGLARFFSILKRLVDLDLDMPDAHRYFLTGSNLPDQVGDNNQNETRDYASTALHESVRAFSYHAVEQLIKLGFDINARDSEGITAFQLAHNLLKSNSGRLLDRSQSVDLDGIVALLGQHTVLWQESDLEGVDDMPLGWKDITDAQSKFSVYQEKHFGSLTLKKPEFSLFTDQRLALGYRRRNVAGQTYHLDLLRFLERRLPTKSTLTSGIPLQEQARLTYTDEWYFEDLEATKYLQEEQENEPGKITSTALGSLAFLFGIFWRLVVNILTILSFFWLLLIALVASICIAVAIEIIASVTESNAEVITFFHLLAISIISYIFTNFTGYWVARNKGYRLPELAKYSGFTSFCFGLWGLKDQRIDIVTMILLGEVICNNFLTLGLCYFSSGIMRVQDILDIRNVKSRHYLILFSFFILAITNSHHLIYEMHHQLPTMIVVLVASAVLLLTFFVSRFSHLRTHTSIQDLESSYSEEEPIAGDAVPISMVLLSIGSGLGIFAYSKYIVRRVENLSHGSAHVFAFVLIPLLVHCGCRMKLLRLSYEGHLERVKVGLFEWTIAILMIVGPVLNIASPIWTQRPPYKLLATDLLVIAMPAMTVPVSTNTLLIPSYLSGVFLVAVYTIICVFYVNLAHPTS